MLKIKIIALGKLTESFFREAAEEYLRRIGKYYSISVVEVKCEMLSASPSENEIKNALAREEVRIKAEIPPKSTVVAMCVEGKMKSSTELSAFIESTATSGVSEICFVIGSSCGLSDGVKSMAKLKLSVSPMTFPHELFRVMLLEQIYRAGDISAGGKYHK